MAYQHQHGNLEKRQQQLVCILNQITQSKYIGVSQQVCSFHPWAGLETSQWEALLVHLWCCWPFWSLVKEIERVVCLEASFGYDRVLGCGHWRIRIFWSVLLLAWVDSTVDWWIEVCTRFTLGRATGLQTLSPKLIILKFLQCVQQSAFVLNMSGDELDRQDTDLIKVGWVWGAFEFGIDALVETKKKTSLKNNCSGKAFCPKAGNTFQLTVTLDVKFNWH